MSTLKQSPLFSIYCKYEKYVYCMLRRSGASLSSAIFQNSKKLLSLFTIESQEPFLHYRTLLSSKTRATQDIDRKSRDRPYLDLQRVKEGTRDMPIIFTFIPIRLVNNDSGRNNAVTAVTRLMLAGLRTADIRIIRSL